MRRKGVYPYEYVDSWKKLEETALPPKEAFYSNLNMKGISDSSTCLLLVLRKSSKKFL